MFIIVGFTRVHRVHQSSPYPFRVLKLLNCSSKVFTPDRITEWAVQCPAIHQSRVHLLHILLTQHCPELGGRTVPVHAALILPIWHFTARTFPVELDGKRNKTILELLGAY